MKFEEYRIAPQVKKNIQNAGFKRPTDIQFKTIPHVLAGEDVLAIAQTGTGKTAAFVIPILHRLLQKKTSKKNIHCLVMAPTHELASQTNQVFQDFAKGTGIRSMVVIGGVDQQPQIDQLQRGVDILIATPGRVFDLVNQGHIKLFDVSVLVIDEADQMLDRGFYKDINDLIRYLPKNRQTLYFSATIDAKIKKLAYSLVKNPIRIQISPKNPVAKNVIHHVAFIEMDDKRFFLERLVDENPDKKILVFVRTKIRAERVMKAMERVNIKSLTIHSDKNQQERDEVMKLFREGKGVKLLVATDVSARGIDIPDVDYVVNYDLPEQAENYVHRVGRTGRGTRKGNAVSFCSSGEKELLAAIEEYIGAEIAQLEISRSDYSATLDFTSDADNNWQKLMNDFDKNIPRKKRK